MVTSLNFLTKLHTFTTVLIKFYRFHLYYKPRWGQHTIKRNAHSSKDPVWLFQEKLVMRQYISWGCHQKWGALVKSNNKSPWNWNYCSQGFSKATAASPINSFHSEITQLNEFRNRWQSKITSLPVSQNCTVQLLSGMREKLISRNSHWKQESKIIELFTWFFYRDL